MKQDTILDEELLLRQVIWYNMDKSMIIVLSIVFIMVISVAIFYSDPFYQHKEVAIGLCELQCNRILHNTSSTINISHGQYCLSKQLIYNYSCAVSNNQNDSLCGTNQVVFLNNQCEVIGVKWSINNSQWSNDKY